MRGSLIVRPSFPCNICGETLAEEDPEVPPEPRTDLVVIENGKILPMYKDPNFFAFHSWADVPPDAMPEGVETEVSIWHAKCFEDCCKTVDSSDHAVSNRYCARCDKDFDDDQYGNMVTHGVIDDEEVFIEDGSAAQIHLCRPCLLKILGEGDEEEGEALLQASLL